MDLSKGIILILEDISDRRKASQMLRQHAEDLRVAKDEADKVTRSKSEFLARMSHEIRTPMNAILGMAEMLQESDLTEEQAEYVKTFSSAGELLLGIINDILDFSKIEVGQIKLESIPFSLRDLVDDVSKLFAYRAEEKDLKLVRFVSSDLAQRYIGDPTRIRQIIINLLGNAIKFTSQGGVTLERRRFSCTLCGIMHRRLSGSRASRYITTKKSKETKMSNYKIVSTKKPLWPATSASTT